MSPTWHLRLFRTGVGRCEDRKYDQHFFLTSGTCGQLQGEVIDDIRMSLTEWTSRHNRWADGEVAELEEESREGRLIPAIEVTRQNASASCVPNTIGCLSLSGLSSFLPIASSFASAASMEPRG